MGWQNLFAALLQAGNTTIVNADGLFIYAGTPALGNLIVSAATHSGVDAEGNAFPQGLNVTMGQISGLDFIVNNQGLFVYSGTPAPGNLIASITPSNGTDPEGNATSSILSIYGAGGANSGAVMNFSVSGGATQQNFITNSSSEAQPGTTFSQINNQGLVNESMSLFFVGPASSFDDTRAVIIHTSAAKDGSSGANAQLVLMQGNTIIATIATWNATGLTTNLPVIFQQFGGTPSFIAGAAVVFSVNGDMQYNDGVDNTTYAMSRRSIVPQSAQNVTSTTFGTILQSPIGAPGGSNRAYRVEARIVINPNQTGGKAGLRWTGPAGVGGFLSYVYMAGTAIDNTGALGNGTSNGGALTMTMTLGTQILVMVTGSINVPAGTTGTFTIDAACGTAGDTFSVGGFSSLDMMPV